MRTITDTADRLRPGDLTNLRGQAMLIVDITDASTPAHPARLAVLLDDPHGHTIGFDNATLMLIDAGDTITYQPGQHRSRRPQAAMDRIQIRRRHIGVEVLDTVGGEWVYVTATPCVDPSTDAAVADERALNLLCVTTATPIDPEVQRIVDTLRASGYQQTAEHVLNTTPAVVDKAVELGLVRVAKVQSTTYNRRGERMLAAA